METTREVWRPVVDFEGLYDVSNLGRIRSCDRWVEAPTRWGSTTRYHKPGRVLREQRKLIKGTYSYAVVNLSRDGIVTTHQVHALVLTAFVGPRPPGKWARHGPAGLMDNRLSNLSWGTPSDNAYDRVRDGTSDIAGHALVSPR